LGRWPLHVRAPRQDIDGPLALLPLAVCYRDRRLMMPSKLACKCGVREVAASRGPPFNQFPTVTGSKIEPEAPLAS